MKRKVLSMLLVLCMLLTSMPLTVFAADDTLALNGYGELNVVVKDVVKTNEDFVLSATIANDSGSATVDLVSKSGNPDVLENQEAADTHTGIISGIPSGTYTLTVTGEKYIPYTQELTFDNDCITITLYNENSVNYGRSDDMPKFGVIAIGDVNGDNVINDDDADAIVDAIAGGDNSLDLSGDGVVDLTDLAYVVRNTDGNQLATPVHTASSLALKELASVEATVGTATATDADGREVDVKDALLSPAADTVVSLAPASGAISESNPVEIALDIADNASSTADAAVVADAITIVPPFGSDNKIAAGTMTVEGINEAGEAVVIEAAISSSATQAYSAFSAIALNANVPMATADDATPTQAANGVAVESDGTIVIDLGAKVAIKKVSIRVTATTAENGNLAEIAKVEFLGNFAERIPEPKLDIPTIDESSIKTSEGEYKSITFSWDRQSNVTGYEISIVGPGVNIQRTTTENTYTFQSDKSIAVLQTYGTYTLQVRSLNGDWKSAWSAPVNYTVTTTALPNAPEMIVVTPGVNSLDVSWKALYDTESWIVYYRPVGSSAAYASQTATTNSARIQGLTGGVNYELYIVGVNRMGHSPNSAIVLGMPRTASGVKMPQYFAINPQTSDDGPASDHIVSATGGRSNSYNLYLSDGTVVAGANATPAQWKEVLFDGDPNTYVIINDWDSGVSYDNFCGPIIHLDDAYTMDTLRISPIENAQGHISRVVIGYHDANDGDAYKRIAGSVNSKYDSEGRRYYEVTLEAPITTDYLEIRTTTDWTRQITMSEVRLYKYDSTLNDAKALFANRTMTDLVDGVTQETIDAIREKANTPDPVSGEKNPRLDAIELLLKQAELALRYELADEVVKIKKNITASADNNLGIASTLSPNQPIGYVAAAGDTINILVGSSSGEANGSATNLNLVAMQYHAEANAWSKTVQRLYIGNNEVTIPPVVSADKERGGALYISYTGGKDDNNYYEIRVMGAQKIPMLDVSGLTGAARTAAIEAYVEELDAYVSTIEALHGEQHTGSANANYAYNEKECFLNSTEIVMNYMIYSFPATQVAAALAEEADKNGETKAERLASAIQAMEEEVKLFYQFKGYGEDTAASRTADRFPTQKLNIRYHKMFTGAFMYAGGQHIGIEFPETKGLFGVSPIVADNGKYAGGAYSGWGIAHEIGHVINASAYAHPEVTNNLFAQLAQIYDETNVNFRPSNKSANGESATYADIYKAVVAGNTGHTGELGIQLAMFWQLHLAYDNDYVYKFYATAAEAQANLFYARVDSYFRNPAKATFTKDGTDIPLVLNSDSDNNFMRVAVRAADKDILDFFRAWGFTPNADTVAYAKNFAKETRKIQYIDDDSRLYRIENQGSGAADAVVTAEITTAKDGKYVRTNAIDISITTNANVADMLGYEIYRNDKLVAFVLADNTTVTYTDNIGTENNKAIVYTVVGVDHLLNTTSAAVVDEIKVKGEPVLDKSGWSVSSSTLIADGEDEFENGSDFGHESSAPTYGYNALFDGDYNVAYTARADYIASVTIDLGGTEQVSAFKLTPGSNATADEIAALEATEFMILVSSDGVNWDVAKYDRFSNAKKVGGAYVSYFSKDGDPFMYTYDAAYIQFMVMASSFTAAEFDILGPTNDNIELEQFGKLSAAYQYAVGDEYVIPAGAYVFYGTFAGDPSYSVVRLTDANDNTIPMDQIILAEVPAEGELGEVSDGSWIAWLYDYEGNIVTDIANLEYDISEVQAELYRVQDAFTMVGQRLTSTSLHMDIDVNGTIPSVDLNSAIGANKVSAIQTMSAPIVAIAPMAIAPTAAVDGDTFTPDSGTLTRDPVILTANESTSSVDFDFNSTLNNYAVYFKVDVSTDGISAGEAGATVTSATLNSENLDPAKYYTNIRHTDNAVEVYVAARYEGVNRNVTGTITVETSGLNRAGTKTVNFATTGFKRVDSAYGIAEVLAPASDSIVFYCEEHQWTVTEVAATCTTPGIVTQTCELCGVTQTVSTTPALGHTPDEWKVVKEATCDNDGLKEQKCAVCGEVLGSEVISALGHADEDGDGICDHGQGTDSEHAMPNSSTGWNSFRCKMCDEYEAHKNDRFVGIFYRIVHFFVHLIQYLRQLF